ncbi:hypothetical protein X011_09320 [Mycobacterium tuberculosis variant microti OV254]|nr:hypothetical protein X011_09320 [Mycobacterium tuberculosis variant microti OV254]BBX43816.1 hypothetical protein MSIM_52670 [Mycobacterium simiae]
MGSRWVVGDRYDLRIPADPASLHAAGAEFPTEAFRAPGVLRDGVAVAGVTDFAEVDGGSTGRKAVLAVESDTAAPTPHTHLFVKFSRDFDDPIRDAAGARSAIRGPVPDAGVSDRGAYGAVRRLPPGQRVGDSDHGADPMRHQRD